ncbi:hypothetical protein BO82DRAFT_350143 [Aspergillus uvarum CBS 121591]|uniref:Uncharacterized protein n=1 Tax=Aspergillus uvarum CBS 121591 TaxID=1448315 RepID=A0A319CPR7_9EURO|nr:hypothetical protein BO82DRAFT_350143 [Aspergillus uvarum CBS 121591]PYH86419.1 hypothetical protein BO82DRAFT_350143 [Aspergillus uvarum CBS 121591]
MAQSSSPDRGVYTTEQHQKPTHHNTYSPSSKKRDSPQVVAEQNPSRAPLHPHRLEQYKHYASVSASDRQR